MNPADLLIRFTNLDSKTLIGTLVWGNLAMGIIVCLYQSSSKYKPNTGVAIGNMVIVRFLSMFGYMCLFLRGSIPGIFSIHIGNSLLFLCLYLESCMLLEITNLYCKKIHLFETAIVCAGIVIFNVQELIFHDPALRIGIASIIILSILFFPAVMLITSKQTTKFKKNIGIFYIPLLFALIPRIVKGLSGGIDNIKANTYYQTLLFISLVLLMISYTIIYLLFIKEKTDSIIEKMANFDNLTDVMNRHSFFSAGKSVFENHKTRRNELSLLFFDLDHFKNINDKYGHRFGDAVLIRFAATIKSNIRPADICCRYGGEEFIVLTSASKEGSKIIAARILKETGNITFDGTPDFHMTTSIGCISGIPTPNETLDDFIAKADTALYQAKREGRNRIIFYDRELNQTKNV